MGIYIKKFYSKSKALSFEYKLKKDRKERFRLLYEFKNLNIATILPYKETIHLKSFSCQFWVSEFYKKSKYKENNIIYGHANQKIIWPKIIKI